jgi:prepilin-type N-terminal cleavage/methylation domain-containing protein
MKISFCPKSSISAFTLIELLIVAALLGLIATSALLLVDSAQDQRRYEETRASYATLSAAILGPTEQTLNGVPLISGYVSDVGALPAVLEDLRAQPTTVVNYGLIGPANKGVLLSHGWRGPYLSLAAPDLRDPWGSLWRYETPATSTSGLLELGSLGRDGTTGGSGAPGTAAEFDADFPPVMTQPSSAYTVTAVPVPGLVLRQDAITPRAVNLGIIKAGLNISQAYLNHPSLVRDAAGTIVSITIPAAPDTVQVPAGLLVDIGLARQFQIGIYDPTSSGTSLTDKLVRAHPQIFTVLPRTTFVPPPISPSPWDVP